jgi:hypothetical protein
MTATVDVVVANGILITMDDLDPRFVDHRESRWRVHQS